MVYLNLKHKTYIYNDVLIKEKTHTHTHKYFYCIPHSLFFDLIYFNIFHTTTK